jgi:hypothetical protein
MAPREFSAVSRAFDIVLAWNPGSQKSCSVPTYCERLIPFAHSSAFAAGSGTRATWEITAPSSSVVAPAC